MLLALFLSCSHNDKSSGNNESNIVASQENEFQSQVTKDNKPLTLSDEERGCVDKANELAFTLMLKQSGKTPYKSFTFSPLGVNCALAMTSNGASGATLKEIENLIGPIGDANSFFSKYVAHLSSSVVISNYLAINNKYPINQDIVKSIEGMYNAHVSNLEFGNNDAIQRINDWIKHVSDGEYESVFDRTNANELVYLITYMKFKALWNNPFKESNTSDMDFTNDDGNTTQVPMMFQHVYAYSGELYYQNDDYKAISLGYEDSEYRMLIVLPNNTKINDFIAVMNANEYNHIISSLKANEETINLSLPRFSTNCTLNLHEMLLKLIPTAFNGDADFSRLSKVKSYLSRFMQDTKVVVTEYGTEASGATKQSETEMSINPDFTANHPFLYFIYDNTTHAILQAGQYCGN